MKTARAVVFVVSCLVAAVAVGVPALVAQHRLPAEPESRTAVQQKIDPQLLKEIYRRRADARHAQPGATGITVDRHGRTLVDVRAQVTDPLKRKIAALGGRVVSTSVEYQTVIALMPVSMVERLAADTGVRSITVAPPAH